MRPPRALMAPGKGALSRHAEELHGRVPCLAFQPIGLADLRFRRAADQDRFPKVACCLGGGHGLAFLPAEAAPNGAGSLAVILACNLASARATANISSAGVSDRAAIARPSAQHIHSKHAVAKLHEALIDFLALAETYR
jgi:hypothetical protein